MRIFHFEKVERVEDKRNMTTTLLFYASELPDISLFCLEHDLPKKSMKMNNSIFESTRFEKSMTFPKHVG